MIGGEGEIRTHDTLADIAVFKTAALNHSATSPFAVVFAGKVRTFYRENPDTDL